MLLILISWLYIFLSSTAVGIGFSKLFKIQAQNIAITGILGLFNVTLLAGTWAFWGSIGLLFHFFLFAVVLLHLFFFWNDFLYIVKKIKIDFLSLPLHLRWMLIIVNFLALAQSATYPFVTDNETYYVQTVKWLNEYGFVPGLANLHLFLGQTSGWHITQSVYSFSFLYDRFNDINGYCLLLLNFWAFQKLNSYFINNHKLDLVFGLLPLTYAFLFQFINAPSPDFGVYVLAFLLFDLYLENSKNFSVDHFKIIKILVLFAIYIKITSLVLLLLPLFIFFKNFTTLRSKMIGLRFLSMVVFVLWAGKNIILTGYPLYPLNFLPYPGADYKVPQEIVNYFFSAEMRHSFYMPFASYQNASVFDFIKNYFLFNKIDSIIGVATLLMVVITPFVIHKYFKHKALWQLYAVFVLLLLLLTLSSPQYRFYVYFTLFFGLLFLSVLINQKRVIITALALSLLVTSALVFVSVSFSFFTSNTNMNQSNAFDIRNVVVPKPNTKTSGSLATCELGNLKYNAPILYSETFWTTGNLDLPSVTKEQLDYFETNFHLIPQLRGKRLEQGFYAKRTEAHE